MLKCREYVYIASNEMVDAMIDVNGLKFIPFML